MVSQFLYFFLFFQLDGGGSGEIFLNCVLGKQQLELAIHNLQQHIRLQTSFQLGNCCLDPFSINNQFLFLSAAIDQGITGVVLLVVLHIFS